MKLFFDEYHGDSDYLKKIVAEAETVVVDGDCVEENAAFHASGELKVSSSEAEDVEFTDEKLVMLCR